MKYYYLNNTLDIDLLKKYMYEREFSFHILIDDLISHFQLIHPCDYKNILNLMINPVFEYESFKELAQKINDPELIIDLLCDRKCYIQLLDIISTTFHDRKDECYSMIKSNLIMDHLYNFNFVCDQYSKEYVLAGVIPNGIKFKIPVTKVKEDDILFLLKNDYLELSHGLIKMYSHNKEIMKYILIDQNFECKIAYSFTMLNIKKSFEHIELSDACDIEEMNPDLIPYEKMIYLSHENVVHLLNISDKNKKKNILITLAKKIPSLLVTHYSEYLIEISNLSNASSYLKDSILNDIPKNHIAINMLAGDPLFMDNYIASNQLLDLSVSDKDAISFIEKKLSLNESMILDI